jgi:alcohol dehydrogenase
MILSQWTRNGIVLKEVEPAALLPGWVRLRVAAAGICGSDLHRLRLHDGVGETPGHEVAGTILEAFEALEDVTYVVDPWIVCGRCEFCRAGKSEQCSEGKAIGLEVAGGLAETIDVPLANLHAVSPQLSNLQASLAEPFAVCVRAIHLAELKLDSQVLVLGAGSLGMISGLLARDRASRVAISTLHGHQVELARKLGLEPVPVSELDAWAKQSTPDVIIEAVGGSADTLEQSMRICRPGGKIIVIGMFTGPTQFDGRALVSKGLRILGSRLYGRTERGSEVGAAAQALSRYAAEASILQTHQYSLPEIGTAFETAANPNLRPVKVTVLP